MSEITNKELADELLSSYAENKSLFRSLASLGEAVRVAADRLVAMPDVGEQEPVKFCWDMGHVNWYLETGELCACKKRTVTSKLYAQPQQPAPDVTIKDLRELINHFYDRRPDTSTNLLADEILNKYKVTQKC